MSASSLFRGLLVLAMAAGIPGCDRRSSPPQTLPSSAESANGILNLLLSEKELADGWISLFDGQTLFGWQISGKANWSVDDETIVVTEGEVGLLCTTTHFSDYILSIDFRGPADTNSGIFLRTPLRPQDPTKDCYELNIAGADNPFPTGSLVGRIKVEKELNHNDWQHFEVTALANQITVKLNREMILQYTDPQPLRRGFIGLQHNQGKVQFRNVKLKPLATNRVFNGENLEGWTVRDGMDSDFSVTPEGYLNVKNGRGQIETVDLYGDFLFQLECISRDRHLNSGIFFRCIPGDVMMGYESQIHNGFHNGDRSRPIDCGTGGIFRRQDARRVVADDFQWFHKTIVADGPHMAVWVNGYQVSDWTDEREPHENPRQGLRLEPGAIIIQGHDPTTNLSFRDLRIGELPVQ